MYYLAESPVKFAHLVGNYFTSKHRLLSQNAELVTQNLLLQAKLQNMLELEKENKRFNILLDSVKNSKNEFTVAKVISVNTDPLNPQIILNKGSEYNISIGQVVLDASGVIGQIIGVNPKTSRVLLITSFKSAVPVKDLQNGIRAIALGHGVNENLQLLYIPDTTEIKEGDLFVTSGLGNVFPEGYPIGKVVEINRVLGNRFAVIKLKPVAKLNTDTQVLLVKR